MANMKVRLPRVVDGAELISIVDRVIADSGHLFHFNVSGDLRCEPGSVKISLETMRVKLLRSRFSELLGVFTPCGPPALHFTLNRGESYGEIDIRAHDIDLYDCSQNRYRYRQSLEAFVQKIYDVINKLPAPVV